MPKIFGTGRATEPVLSLPSISLRIDWTFSVQPGGCAVAGLGCVSACTRIAPRRALLKFNALAGRQGTMTTQPEFDAKRVSGTQLRAAIERSGAAVIRGCFAADRIAELWTRALSAYRVWQNPWVRCR